MNVLQEVRDALGELRKQMDLFDQELAEAIHSPASDAVGAVMARPYKALAATMRESTEQFGGQIGSLRKLTVLACKGVERKGGG